MSEDKKDENNNNKAKEDGKSRDEEEKQTTLAQLEQDVLRKSQVVNGVTPSSSSSSTLAPPQLGKEIYDGSQSGGSSLDQLEQELLTKNQGRLSSVDSNNSSRPGAYAVDGQSSSSQLSRLEQEVLMKSQMNHSMTPNGDKQRGVDTLSQLERDIALKARTSTTTTSRPGAHFVPNHSSTLDQLERDITAKNQVRSSDREVRPGAYPSNSLDQFERDVMSKSHSGSIRSDASASTGNSLSQLEREVLAKSQGSRNYNHETTPGATAVPGSHGMTLSQLENDVMAKNQIRPMDRAVAPGAFASSSLDQFERDVMAKSHVGSIRSDVSGSTNSSLCQLERDVLAKSYGIRNNQESGPGATAVQGSHGVTLSQLERDVMAKSQVHTVDPTVRPGAVASNSLDQFERDVLVKGGGVAVGSTSRSLSQLKHDVLAKSNDKRDNSFAAVNGGNGMILSQNERDATHKSLINQPNLSNSNDGRLSQLEQEVLAKSQGRFISSSMPGISATDFGELKPPPSSDTSFEATNLIRLENDVLAKQARGSTPQLSPACVSSLHQLERDVVAKSHATEAIIPLQSSPKISLDYRSRLPGYGERNAFEEYNSVNSPHHDAANLDDMQSGSDPEAPVYHESEAPCNYGIQAFVAETVVDATGVAVILSEEEEERIDRFRQKKFAVYGILCFAVILITVVVTVAAIMTGDNAPAPGPLQTSTQPPTMAPTSTDLPGLVSSLAGISTTESLRDRSSPQFRAAHWLTMEDPMRMANDGSIKFLERYIMAVLYFSFNGDGWRVCSRSDPRCGTSSTDSWLSNNDVCRWLAVSCNEQGAVISIDFGMCLDRSIYFWFRSAYVLCSVLTYFFLDPIWPPVKDARQFDTPVRLTGAIPEEINKLAKLEQFIAPGHKLSGNLESILHGLDSLREVNLANNDIAGSIPTSIHVDHPNLVTFRVGYNFISGPIPESFSQLSSLRNLDLSANRISGTIPSGIWLLPMLAIIELQDNYLHGTLPMSVYNNRTSTLRLGDNELEGEIMSEIGRMTSLRDLHLGNSRMGGTIPAELFTLPLRELNLGNAKFEGELVNDQFLQLKDSMIFLYLNNNNFSGAIPQALDEFLLLQELNFRDNALIYGSISQALCSRRGFGLSRISVLEVDCAITCTCCGTRSECANP